MDGWSARDLGIGIGLRPPHFTRLLSGPPSPAVRWLEALSENHMGLEGAGAGRPGDILLKLRETYPIALHGVSLSIGSTDPLNLRYLERLRALARSIEPWIISDHVCWTGVGGENLHDLLPLPYTEETLRHLVPRVQKVQELLGRPLMLENVSSYLTFTHSELTEWSFLAELSRRSGCLLLLDVNNVYVSSINHGFNALEYLDGIPRDRVAQMHLAGHTNCGTHLIDTHDHPVSKAVWKLYGEAVARFGRVPTLVERDDRIPPFAVLEREARRAAEIMNSPPRLNDHEHTDTPRTAALATLGLH